MNIIIIIVKDNSLNENTYNKNIFFSFSVFGAQVFAQHFSAA